MSIVTDARAQVGKSYVLGAQTNSALTQFAYDCSSLVQSVAQHAGLSFPWRTSQQQAAAAIPTTNPQPGDLVFSGDNGHVGIYAGPNDVIAAVNEQYGVKETPIAGWGFSGVHYGRIPGLTMSTDPSQWSTIPSTDGSRGPGSDSNLPSTPANTGPTQGNHIAYAGLQWHQVLVGVVVVGASIWVMETQVGGQPAFVFAIIILLGAMLTYKNFSQELTSIAKGKA